MAKAFGKVLDDIPAPALKPSTATNAGRNLVESGSKSAGRVGGSSFDELATVSLVSKSRNAADHGTTFAGKSSSFSRNADEGMDYGRQAVAKSPANNKVTDLSEYKAKKAETSNPAEAVDEDLNFGKSANHNVQSMDMAEKLGSKSSNVISMDVQAKAPIKKKVVNGFDYDDSVELPQTQLKLVVDNTSVKNVSEGTANVGRVDSSVDGIPSASGASRGPSSGGKIGTEGAGEVADVYKINRNQVDNALEGYQQISKNRAIYQNSSGLELEVRAQRSLEHLSDKQLIYNFKKGFSPKDENGDTIVLHHHLQNSEGPIIEMPSPNHKLSNTNQHPYGNKGGIGKGESRKQFDRWRENYWKSRYAQEINRRGLLP